MQLDPTSTTPIYMQIAEWLENEILIGHFVVNEKVHSQYTLAELFQINPATAAKGLTVLGDQGILYDKRGLGKFVAEDAIPIIRKKRKDHVMETLIEDLIKEAKFLQIDVQELMERIEEKYEEDEQ